MKLKHPFLIYFLLVSFFVFSQNEEFNYKQKIDNIISLHYKNNALDSVCYVAHEASKYYNKKGDYPKAIYYALEEVQLGKKNLTNKKYKIAINNLGIFYFKNNQYFKAIEAYSKVIDSFSTDQKTYKAYCEIGRNYRKLGDFYQAITYYNKGLAKPEFLKPKDLLNQTINLALVYDNIDTKDAAKKELATLKKADSIFNNGNFSNMKFYTLKNTFGLYYKNDLTYNFKLSKSYFLKVLEKSIIEKDTFIQRQVLNNLGELHNKAKNDSAYYYINEGLKITENEHYIKAQLHSNLAEYYFLKNQNDKSLKELQNSLKTIVPKSLITNKITIPKIEALELSNNKYLALDNLKAKAKIYLSSNTFLALQHLHLADKLLDIIKAESFETKSKLFWQKQASELYMLAVEAALDLNNPEDAFYFIEKNKAVLLLENIDENQLKKQSNIANNVLEKEAFFKKDLSDLENLINDFNTNTDSLQTKYFSLKIEYKNFIESLKLEYPKYYSYKNPIQIQSLNHFKKTLPKNTIAIQYIMNSKKGYVLCFTNANTYFLALNNINDLQSKIENYLNIISKPLNTKKDLENYSVMASELKQILLPFINSTEFLGKTKLLIIPDYTLQNLPFESLKQNNKYLIEDYEISYAYSLSFLEKNSKLKRNAEHTFLGFAPNTFNYDNLQNLPLSKTETQNISNLLKGRVLLDNSASKELFISKANNYKILHLSTHANANDSISPWIAFKNQKLFLNQLYTTKNQAELVVLNACNSSLGKLNSGEGVFSLARGFFYSGSNSVISSLWNVNDKSNAKITTSFYQYLKKGVTKSKALRQAKLDYLKSHSLSEASPYYWSSLILIGDNSSIKAPINLLNYTLLVVFIAILLIFLLKKLKYKGNK